MRLKPDADGLSRPISLLRALDIARGGVVALAGAGGKSTLAQRLAREGAGAGLRTIVTATTRLGATAAQAGALCIEDPAPRSGPRAADAEIAQRLREHGCIAVSGPREAADRWSGLPPHRVDALAALGELVLVETDGARGRLLKLPAEHEPLLPGATTLLLIVAGLEVLGRTLAPDCVHRFERVVSCLGLAPGATIDEPALTAVLLHSEGYLGRTPRGARVGAFLSLRADNPAHAEAAARVAPRLLARYDVVVAACARSGAGRAWWAERARPPRA